MKAILKLTVALLALPTVDSHLSTCSAQGTAFTYQGRLDDAGSPANGLYDLRFTLYNQLSGGSTVGAPITRPATPVSGGVFTVVLDYGAGVFDGSARWIEIAVRTNSAAAVFVPLAPRQPITAAPYAIFASGGPGAAGPWALTGTHIFNTNSGNVGIGMPKPAAKLHIAGGDLLIDDGSNFRMANGLDPNIETVFLDSQFFGGSLLRLRDNAGTGTIELRSDSGQVSLFNSGGARVTLSANTPAQGGSISLRNDDNLVTALLQGEEQVNFGAALTLANASASTTISLFGDGGSGEARAGVAGDVGAGTTAPQGRLHVRGRANDTRPSLLVETLSGSPTVFTTSIELLGNAINAYFQGGPSALRLNPNSAGNILLALGGGRVGVNTVTPDAKLHVAGADNASVAGGGLMVIEHAPSGNELAFDGNEIQARNSGSAITFNINAGGGNVSLVQSGAGQVGIGTGLPQGKLHVRSASVGVTAADTQNDELVIEDSDARLGIYSSDAGVGGSSIALAELSGGVFEDQWGIIRETTSAGDTLWFTFGPSTAPLSNPGIMALEPNGTVFINEFLEVQGDIAAQGMVLGPNQAGFELTVQGNASIGDLTVLDDVSVLGNLGVNGTKQFLIDDPRDPANRYLRHYCHEGAEPQNIYNGIVTLDANGQATVQLPDYFRTINRDPRYSLTPIGAAMPNLHVAETIDLTCATSSFRVAGGVPGKQVSWEIKAIRNDPTIRETGICVEIEKQDGERGRYLRPDLYGQAEASRTSVVTLVQDSR